MRFQQSILLLAWTGAILSVVGCSSSSSAPPPPAISVAFMTPPPSSVQEGGPAMLTAVVSKDSSNAGVDWSVTCGTAGACGSFSPTHTASGSATTYTAPVGVPAGNTVSISVASTADNTKSVSATITISTPADRLLSGNYVFELSGEDNSGSPYSLAGQLTADGAGNITGGEQDFSDLFNSLVDPLTGTYSIAPDGQGTITINTGDFSLPGGGTETFSIVAISGSHALVTEFDFSATSSGTMDLQTVPSGGFSVSTLSGGYAFVLFGIDVNTQVPLGWGGVTNIDSPGGISGAGSVADINDGGTVSTNQGLSGSVLSVDSLGRADILLTAGSFAGVKVIAYIADAAHLKLVEIDGVLGVTGGTGLGQGTSTGTFNSNAALSGNLALRALGIGAPFVTTTAAGHFTADGGGNISNGVLDVNASGVPTNGAFTGTYSVDTSGSGRGTATLTGNTGGLSRFAFYLPGSGNPAMLLELDPNSITSGAILQRAAGPFSAASFMGPFAMNFMENFLLSESDATGQASADGIGNLTGTANINDLFTPEQNQALTGTFTANSNGRFPGTLNTTSTGTINGAFYIVDSGQLLFIETDATGVTLAVLQVQPQPLF